MPSIIRRVQQLLECSTTQPLSDSSQYFGYEGVRTVYRDPSGHGSVLRISAQDLDSDPASPNARDEILMQMHEVKLSALALSKDKIQKQAILNAYGMMEEKLAGILGVQANLYEAKGSGTNTAFQKQLKSLSKDLGHFIDTVAIITNTSRSALDKQGHDRRSAIRPTIVHEFTTTQTKPGETQFVVYQPAGRLTDKQKAIRALQGDINPETHHSTTSHNKSGMVQGNSSFVRMIVGTRQADGSVTIANDSFSGPGARLPYEDLKGADEQKRMAVKATTFLNQEEIIQALAQRIYDKHLVGQSDEAIKAYFRETPLSETYMQVNTPTQGLVIPFGLDGDQNLAQFEFVRDAIRAFDGSGSLPLKLDVANDREVTIDVAYKGHHAAFGVNIGSRVLPQWVEGAQNNRFMNEMLDETIASLSGKVTGELANDFDRVQRALEALQGQSQFEKSSKAHLFWGEGTPLLTNKQNLLELRKEYRDAMVEYLKVYSNVESNPLQINDAIDKVLQCEKSIKSLEDIIDADAKYLNDATKSVFQTGMVQQVLNDFKVKAEARIVTINEALQIDALKANHGALKQEKAKIQSSYNSCAYLIEAQSLFFSGNWRQAEHNFELQTLMSSLANELGHANTKGCKSNNDRGQRLAQKISGNALVTSMSETGLYTGEYFEDKDVGQKQVIDMTISEQVDRQLPAIQSAHHTANTGVGGGKFGLRNKKGFADNELLGKVANLAKLKSVGKKEPLYKNKLFIGAVAVLAIGSAVAFPVLPIAFLATATAAATMVASVVAITALVSFAKDKWRSHQIRSAAKAEAKEAIMSAHNQLEESSQFINNAQELNIPVSTKKIQASLGRGEPEQEQELTCEMAQGVSDIINPKNSSTEEENLSVSSRSPSN